MQLQLLQELQQQNPWLSKKDKPILEMKNFRERLQLDMWMLPEWDQLWTVLVGPRRAGKTTLEKLFTRAMTQLLQRDLEENFGPCSYQPITFRKGLEKRRGHLLT